MAVAEGSAEWLDKDLEARKHLLSGLARLTAPQRVAFVRRMCARTRGQLKEAKVTASSESARETYWDLCYLAVIHGVSLADSCVELERLLRKL